MDLHERYARFPTTDASILGFAEATFNNDPFTLLHNLVRYYDAKVMENSLDNNQLKTFRMILCYEYQLVHCSGKKYPRTVRTDLCFKTIKNVLYTKMESQDFLELSILYDIVLLHTVLYCNSQCIGEHLVEFQSSNIQILNDNISRVFYMKIMECFLEALQLRQFLHKDMTSKNLRYFMSLFLEDITMWLEAKEHREWQTFASYFPILINTFGSEHVLPPIWYIVLNKLQDSKDILSMLSIITDTCFSPTSKDIDARHYTLCYTEQLWLLIIRTLKSPTQQYRKQALFIMKRITDFMSNIGENVGELRKPDIVPFVCKDPTKIEAPIAGIRQKFFLVLEALEEKQYHLIVPALTHLPKLVKGNKEHGSCNDCFNNYWLQLIFERLFHHENNTIVKLGILYVCELRTIIHNHQFLKLFVCTLNNTFLYECKSHQQEPKILNDIVTLFVHVRNEDTEFIDKLLTIMNEQKWAPIPIFYMMLILRIVSSKTSNSWEGSEIVVTKSLVQKNLSMHSHILRIASQIELLKTITLSVKKIHDLKAVIDTLLEFPIEEALVRGSFSWNIITTWLRNALTVNDATKFVKCMCKRHFSYETHLNTSPAKFAIIIFILHDAGLILQQRPCCAEETLNNWLSSLNGITQRPYADITQIFYITEVMSHFLNLSALGTSKSIVQLLFSHINNAFKFLLKNCTNIPSAFNYEEVNRYLAVIVSFLSNGTLILPKKDIIVYVEYFKNTSTLILKNIDRYTSVHYMCALHILHFTQSVNSTLFYVRPLLDIYDMQIVDNDQDVTTSRGKIASDCYLLLAKLTNQFLSRVELDLWPENINWFENIFHLYEMGGSEIVPEIALILKVIVERGLITNPESRSSFETIFNTCWRSTLSSTKNKVYFTAIKNLIGVILNSNFLVLPKGLDFVQNILGQLLQQSNDVPKLKKILLNELKLLNACCLKNVQDPLAQCLLHGHVFRKDKQIENEAYLYIAKNYKDCYPEHISMIDHDNDASIRALSAVLFHKITSADNQHASVLFPDFLQKLAKYKNKRYFNNSSMHKTKHRILQSLLILQPNLNKLNSALLQERLCSLMLIESNQHSVRLMQEWILIRIFVDNITFRVKLWQFFEQAIATRPGCVSSVACIVYHVSKLLPEENQRNFISVGIQYIARCCLGQQYNMRLYSQVIFVKLYKMLENLNCDDVTLEYRGLYEATVESLKDGNFMKNSSKLLNDFYLSFFHPVQDYSLETIYFELPRLTGMDASEWITPDIFRTLNFKENNRHPLRLLNSSRSLSETRTSLYLMKATADAESTTGHSILGTSLEELSDIQKKINPAMSTNALNNDIYLTVRESMSQRKVLTDEGLIVVASLVDRAPNLGGLARTCEIFKVNELVIANLNQVKDKDFQTLSVSAEKWITMTEIKPHQLSKYLLEKRNMGWRLVGVEQTANSTNLLNMKFEKKTVLVLGNEKDGIPANLIPLFDTCIEIPQLGIIRSLNVHVSGAICIWQYTTQHMLT